MATSRLSVRAGGSSATSRSNLSGAIKSSRSRNAAAVSVDLSPGATTSTTGGKNNQKKTSVLDKLGNVITSVVKDTAKAGRAIARPTVDIATGQGGKAAHDTAQLSSDVSGGSINTTAKGLAYVPKAVYREVQDKPIDDIQKKVFGTTDSGTIAKKIAASTVGNISLVAGGGEGKAVIEGGEVAAKTGLGKVMQAIPSAVKLAAAGGAGNASQTELKNPNSSAKDLIKSGVEGAAVGAVLPGAGKLVKGAVDSVLNRGANKTISKAYEDTVRNGGVTINLKGKTPADGYAFAPNKNTEISVASKDFTPKTVADFVKANKEELSQPGNHVGTWVDGNKTYLDISRVGSKSPETIAEAQKGSQLAVGDLGMYAAGKDGTVPIGQIGKKGVYSPLDEATSIHNSHTGQDTGTGGQGSAPGASEVPKGAQGSADKASPQNIVAKVPRVAAGDTRTPILNRNFAIQQYQSLKGPVQQAAKGMSEKDIALLDKIEGNHKSVAGAAKHLETIASQADNPAQFKKVAGLIRQGYDTRLAGDTSLGREVGKRLNYLPHIFDRTNKSVSNLLDSIEGRRTIMSKNAAPGYTKPRTVNSYEEANRIKLKDETGNPLKDESGKELTLGDFRKNKNALEDFYQSMDAAGQEHGSQLLRKGIEEAHPGVATSNKVGLDRVSGKQYEQLKIPGAGNITVPSDIARIYNKRAQPDIKTTPPGERSVGQKVHAGYKRVNQAAKNTLFAGGLFHGTRIGIQTAGQQLVNRDVVTHPLQHIVDNLNIIKSTLSKGAHANYTKSIAGDAAKNPDNLSTLDRQQLAGLTYTPEAIKADVGTAGKKGILNRLPVLKQTHAMVFERQIPTAKSVVFSQLTRGLDTRNPGDLLKMQRIADGLNKLDGGIDHAVNGLSPKMQSALDDLAIAGDFQHGRFSTFKNAFAKWGADHPEGKLARQAVVGTMVVAALPGTVAAVATGRVNPRDPKAMEKLIAGQLINPQVSTDWRGAPTKSNPDGNTLSLKLPAGIIPDLVKIIQPALNQFNSGGDKLQGVKDFAASRLSVIPAFVEKNIANSDYYGQPIHGTDKQGNPISPSRTAISEGEQLAPIPATQAERTASGKSTATQAGLNELGFKTSSDTSSATAAHSSAVSDFFNTKNQIGTQRSKIVKQINNLITENKVNQANRLADQWNKTLPSKLAPFNAKYQAHYNPAWYDPKNPESFHTLLISNSSRSVKTRQNDAKAEAAVLSNNY